MNTKKSAAPSPKGFTLAELIIVIAVIAILVAIALPSYQAQIRKSRRSDAISALAAVQLAQEKYRASNPSYGATLADIGVSSTSPDGYYSVSIVPTPNATSFTARATPVVGKSQAGDTSCLPYIELAVAGALITHSPTACWNR